MFLNFGATEEQQWVHDAGVLIAKSVDDNYLQVVCALAGTEKDERRFRREGINAQ